VRGSERRGRGARPSRSCDALVTWVVRWTPRARRRLRPPGSTMGRRIGMARGRRGPQPPHSLRPPRGVSQAARIHQRGSISADPSARIHQRGSISADPSARIHHDVRETPRGLLALGGLWLPSHQAGYLVFDDHQRLANDDRMEARAWTHPATASRGAHVRPAALCKTDAPRCRAASSDSPRRRMSRASGGVRGGQATRLSWRPIGEGHPIPPADPSCGSLLRIPPADPSCGSLLRIPPMAML